MKSITYTDILTIIYVWVDDWVQGQRRGAKRGRRAVMSDSEILTLMLGQEFLPYGSERAYLEHIRNNYLGLFPDLVDQSQYNRRSRKLAGCLEQFRQALLRQEWREESVYLILDAKPIPVVGLKRDNSHSDHLGSAAYGRCVARALYYWGYKLILLTTAQGMPLLYDLVPANTGDAQAGAALLQQVYQADVFADKGFIGKDWTTALARQNATTVWVPPRSNQSSPLPDAFWDWIQAKRQRIETTFDALQEHGRNVEHLLAKTVYGLASRLVAKITAHTFARIFLS